MICPEEVGNEELIVLKDHLLAGHRLLEGIELPAFGDAELWKDFFIVINKREKEDCEEKWKELQELEKEEKS